MKKFKIYEKKIDDLNNKLGDLFAEFSFETAAYGCYDEDDIDGLGFEYDRTLNKIIQYEKLIKKSKEGMGC